ncbi:MAG: diguanylate cyclase [Actinomycetes bacterium]
MTLRTRLALVLVALVLAPLVAAAILILYAVPRATADRADSLVLGARSAVTNDISQMCDQVATAAVVTGRALGSATPASATRQVVADGLADWVSVVNNRGNVVASAGLVRSDFITEPWSDCTQGEAGGPALSTEQRVLVADQSDLSSVRAANSIDSSSLDDLRSRLGFTADVVLLLDGTVVASTSDATIDLALVPELVEMASAGGGMVSSDGVTAAVAPAVPGMPFDVVVATPTPGTGLLVQTVFLVAIVAIVVAVVAAVAIARDLTGPLEDVTEAAEAVASGDLTKSIDVRRSDEVGRLARAFNHMTDELLSYVTELEGSRDALKANFDRLGDTLSATLDLDTLVPVVLETAMTSVGADAGLIMLGDENGGLTLQAEHGMRTRSLSVPDAVVVGQGLLGSVAASGLAIRGQIGTRPELRADPSEPQSGPVLAVALRRPPHVFGVIAVFAPAEGVDFDDAAESTLEALAGPASIAVENVLLHDEATRASTIDQMTGLWNYRYLMTSLNREVERAHRFDRSLSVLMLDLDHFKRVNDNYGHPRGDAVLREFAARVQAEVREVDTVARYGGEEFAVVLPETTSAGAENLAERICAAIRAQPFTMDGAEVPLSVTVSIGGAVYPAHGNTSRDLIHAADRALYSAKESGRDRWSMAVDSQRVADR